MKWNILAFLLSFLLAIVLPFLLYLNSVNRIFWLQHHMWPLELAFIATLAGLILRDCRTYLIGFAVMVAFLLFSYDWGGFLTTMLFAPPSQFTDVDRMVIFQFLRLGFAVFSAFVLSGIAIWHTPNSKPSDDPL